jgi:hypothetical protein
MAKRTISLTSTFQSPHALAQLQVLLIVATAIRGKLSDLYECAGPGASREWHEIIGRFAEDLSREMQEIQTTGAALRIWANFERSQFATNSPATSQVLKEIGDEIQRSLESGSDPLVEIEDANTKAYAWISTLVQTYNVSGILPKAPAKLTIDADFEGRKTCASSSPLIDNITWFFQYGPQSLWGALSLEAIFRHEYLSHILPRCRGLGKEVREGWLMSTLVEEMQQSEDSADAPIQVLILLRFREELARFLGKNIQSVYCPPGIDRGAVKVRATSTYMFWALNRDLLKLDYQPEIVRRITTLLYRLSFMRERELRKLAESEWPGIMKVLEVFEVRQQAARGLP